MKLIQRTAVCGPSTLFIDVFQMPGSVANLEENLIK